MAYPARRFVQLRSQLTTLVAYLTDGNGQPNDNATRLGMPLVVLTSLVAYENSVIAVFADYADPDTRSPVNNGRMRAEADGAEPVVRRVRNIARAHPAATDQDAQVIGFKFRTGGGTPAEDPTTTVSISMTKTEVRRITYRAIEQTPTGAASNKFPEKFKLQVEKAITDTSEVPAEGEFHFDQTTRRQNFSIAFSAAQAGRYVHTRARFINTRNVVGEWSNVRSNLII